jgi:amino acid adenylation domain-containing protein
LSERPIPLCHPQRRTWMNELMAPGTGVGNLAGCVHLPGSETSLDAIAGAVRRVFARHEALRLRLVPAPGGHCAQRLGAPLELSMPVWDCGPDRAELLAESRRPFALFDGPPVMVRLLRLEQGRVGWFFKYHHIFVDAWSVALLNRQILHLLRTGEEPGPQPSFLDFMERERRYLLSAEREEDEAFWHEELAGLALDEPASDTRSVTTRRYEHELDAQLSDAIRELCAGQRSTVFRFFLALFGLHFSELGQRREVVLSTGHHNRLSDAEKAAVGMSVSTLPLRVTVDPDEPFERMLPRVHRASSACLRRQRYPYDLLASHLRAQGLEPRGLLRTFVNHIPSLPMGGGGAPPSHRIERYSPGADLAELDIKINPNQRPPDAPLQLGVDARCDRHDAAAMARFFALVEHCARQVVARPSITPRELERTPRRLRSARLEGPAPTLEHASIARAFAAAVARDPEKLAVVDGDGRLSAAELNARVEALAARLHHAGIGPGAMVAVISGRSAAYLEALLAVLRVGACWVPITPELPPARQRELARDAGVQALLLDRPPGAVDPSIPTLPIRGGAPAPAAPWPAAGPEAPAYLLYTSGSTGRPKGVLIPHRAVLSLASWFVPRCDMGPEDRCGAYCSFGFDISIIELLVPLLAGAAVVIAPEEARRDIKALARFYRAHEVTVAALPTRVGELFMDHASVPSLRLLSVGGEVLHPRDGLPYRVLNAYGPTEACVYVSAHELSDGERPVPIGRLGPGCAGWVVDGAGRCVALGEEGELWLAGPQIAQGYHARDELTRAAFVPNPWATGQGDATCYRTGDRVRMRPGGVLEFAGRRDRQLKLRGVRSEPAELERCLAGAQGVERCAVVVRTGERGPELIACCTPRPGAVLTAEPLLRRAEASLPAALVPSAIVLLPRLPLTPNGKLDQAAVLAAAEQTGPATACEEPRDETEAALLELMRRVLGRADLGVTDPFFEHGGDSLLAMELFASIEDRFGELLPPSSIFGNPTARALAGALAELRSAQDGALLDIRPAAGGPTLVLVHDFTADLLSYTALLRSLDPELGLLGLRWDGQLAGDAETVEALASRYLERLTQALPRGPYHLVGYSIGGTIAWEMARQLEARGDELALLTLIDIPNYVRHMVLLERFLSTAARNILAWLRGMSLNSKLALISASVGRVPNPARLLALVRSQRRMKSMAMAYSPGPVAGPVLLLASDLQRKGLGPDLGWGELCPALSVERIGGDHISIMNEVHAPACARAIHDHLARTRAAPRDGDEP